MPRNLLDTAELLRTRGTTLLGDSTDENWRRVNEASLSEYRTHHEEENYPPATLVIMSMFEGFIAKWAKRWNAGSMLDLGCGIGTKLPPYVRGLAESVAYAGLDPFKENLDREYSFIWGRLEDLAQRTLQPKFDLAIFATSLDHFENAEDALALLPSVVTGGRAILWCGVHDSALVSANFASARITQICQRHRSVPGRILAFLAYAFLTWPRVVLTLARRERALKAGKPLDQLHFHYFTEAELTALLNRVGTVHELVRCPGTNSFFAAVTIAGSSE